VTRIPRAPSPRFANAWSSASANAGLNWPTFVRFRPPFAYVDGVLPDGEVLPLCRLRYGGFASLWGFAIFTGSGGRYEDSILPSGMLVGEPQEALDCACGLYLSDPSAWSRTSAAEP